MDQRKNIEDEVKEDQVDTAYRKVKSFCEKKGGNYIFYSSL